MQTQDALKSAAPAFYPAFPKPLEHSFPFDPTYGCDYETLLQVGAPDEPPGLGDFWKQTYREAIELPLRLERRKLNSNREDIDLFEVTYDSWDGIRIGAWLTIPCGRAIERGVVMGHGYGGREQPEFDLPGPLCAAIFPCARGMGLSRHPKIPDSAAFHVIKGIDSRESYVHRGCVIDYWRAASALLEIVPTAAKALHYMGTSFGGGIGAMALAWDPRFTAGYLCVPSFGNHPLRVTLPCNGSGEAVRIRYRRHPELLEVLRWFDAATMARHIRIPVLCDCALFDPAVPPPGQFAVFNALAGPKELIVRQAGHFNYPDEVAEANAAQVIQERFFTNPAGAI